MPVSVTMPRLGESVSEGTVTRWLKKEGERVEVDEPLLEVSTDKVDTEIPAPTAGVVRSIKVAEDETVEVGAELAVIDEGGEAGESGGEEAAAHADRDTGEAGGEQADTADAAAATGDRQPSAEPGGPGRSQAADETGEPAGEQVGEMPGQGWRPAESAADGEQPRQPAGEDEAAGDEATQVQQPAAPGDGSSGERAAAPTRAPGRHAAPRGDEPDGEAGYVTPLVRKLAAETGVDLSQVQGTGIGGRIRKQDVLEAARAAEAAPSEAAAAEAPPAERQRREPTPAAQQDRASEGPPASPAPAAADRQEPSQQPKPAQPAAAAASQPAPAAPSRPATPAAERTAALTQVRGRTEKLSRLRQVIAQRMTESLRVSAQLTTVTEVDVTAVARLRERARADFEAREGVRLSFLPFFALATCEALKAHPAVNSSIDQQAGTVTYHDEVHLGIAVDTERGLLVPVIHGAGDLNLGGLARKIGDLAERTRHNQVTPDELGGGTFTLTNTGSRGALFDTPIINQPQVGILGTGAVVKRPAVLTDPTVGEVIAVRSMVYLALTYDHRIVDGADAARFLATVKSRLEEGDFAGELGISPG